MERRSPDAPHDHPTSLNVHLSAARTARRHSMGRIAKSSRLRLGMHYPTSHTPHPTLQPPFHVPYSLTISPRVLASSHVLPLPHFSSLDLHSHLTTTRHTQIDSRNHSDSIRIQDALPHTPHSRLLVSPHFLHILSCFHVLAYISILLASPLAFSHPRISHRSIASERWSHGHINRLDVFLPPSAQYCMVVGVCKRMVAPVA